MSNIRYFECGKPGCSFPIPFDIKKVSREEEYYIVCNKCLKKWYVTITGSGCCSIHVKFCSIEKNNRSIIKHKAFSKHKR